MNKKEQARVDGIYNYICGAVAALYPGRSVEVSRTGYKIEDGGVLVKASHWKTAEPLIGLLRVAPVVRPFMVEGKRGNYTMLYTVDGDLAENAWLFADGARHADTRDKQIGKMFDILCEK